MAILLSNTFANNLLGTGTQGVATQVGGGTLVLYAGTPPAGPNEALSSNTVLVTFTFGSAGVQGSPSAGTMNITFANTTVAAVATGTATFWRILNSGGSALIQGTAGTSGADWNLTSVAISTGSNVSITGTPSISWTTT